MAASQMFDQLERASVAHRPPHTVIEPTPWGTGWVAERTGASKRQIDYWSRHGLLGRRVMGLGSGALRRFEPGDVEVISALAALAALGCREPWLDRAVHAVRAARVDAGGERLTVTLDGTCYRHPADQPVKTTGPCWVVPLAPCPFSPAGDPTVSTAGVPAGDDPKDVA